MNYTAEQMQAAADQLGFENIELAVEYFRQKQIADGLYETLRAQVQ